MLNLTQSTLEFEEQDVYATRRAIGRWVDLGCPFGMSYAQMVALQELAHVTSVASHYLYQVVAREPKALARQLRKVDEAYARYGQELSWYGNTNEEVNETVYINVQALREQLRNKIIELLTQQDDDTAGDDTVGGE